MLEFALSILAAVRVFFRSRSDTALAVLALRQQVAVLKRKRPRPPLSSFGRLLWTTLRRLWSGWADVLVIVKPETVIGWHRAGVRLYEKDTPNWRPVERKPSANAVVISNARLGGLHHRYSWREAA